MLGAAGAAVGATITRPPSALGFPMTRATVLLLVVLLVGAGVVPEEEAALAQLDVERERALAGDASEYAKTRDAVLAACAKRWAALVAQGALAEDEAAGAQIALEKRFPPLPTEPPAGK